MYFEKELLGTTFSKICEILPFSSSLTIIKGVLNNNNIISVNNIILFIIYLLITLILASVVFNKGMTSDDK